MKGIYIFGAFVAGAAIGAFATKHYLDKKYNQMLEEEIEELKEHYNKKNKKKEEPAEEDKPKPKQSQASYVEGLKNPTPEEMTNYNSLTSDYSKPKFDEPYTISPDEYGEEYDIQALTYYADGVLADMDDNVIDIKTYIGTRALNTFGEYENDIVFVRNDTLQIDFEISRDERTFEEVTGEQLHYLG